MIVPTSATAISVPLNSRVRMFFVAVVVALYLFLPTDATAEQTRVGHVRVELVSEVTAIEPGRPFWVGLHMLMDEHWHVYWRNPGDAGLPPKITWDLPPGFTADSINWPHPDRFDVPPLTSFGYYGEVLLPVMIVPAADIVPGSQITLWANAEWLVCKEACIPGEAALSLTLPVIDEALEFNASTVGLFNETRARFPVDQGEWRLSAVVNDSLIIMNLRPPSWYADSLHGVHFFPYEKGIIHNAAAQTLWMSDRGYVLTVPRFRNAASVPERLIGSVYAESGWRGPGSEQVITVDIAVGDDDSKITVITDGAGVWKALVFAFLGGMILNLMPCVLPVLSLKILGFVNKAKTDRTSAASHGLVFTGGVLVSFWVLAGALLVLRAGGAQLGWGFQLQSPIFLVVLSMFVFLFGLSLLGVFEIGTSLTSVGTAGQSSEGWMGSFLTGVTATVVATPCTAPFMGSALGYSLTQPAWVSMFIFTALALGMAAPYVALSVSPKLLKFVPRPGRWMETFKQGMGFILLATVVWLAWVLGIQAGVNALAVLLAALLVIGIGAWVFGRWGTVAVPMPRRGVAFAISGVLLAGGLSIGLMGVSAFHQPVETSAGSSSGESIAWEPYSQERYESALEAGSPVFIDFTAAWCLSCQVNERVALDTREVQRTFSEKRVVALKADWTSRDDTITRALARYGRNSVPLYILYDGNGRREPIILPEIITPGIVLEALSEVGG